MDLTKADLRPYVDYEVSGIMPIKEKFGFRVTLIYEDLSKRECQHSGFLKKAEAEKTRDSVIAQLHDKRYVAYKNVKVEELLKYWLEYEMRPRQGFTANSYTTYNVNNLIKATTIYSVCHSKIYIIFSSAQDFSVPSL